MRGTQIRRRIAAVCVTAGLLILTVYAIIGGLELRTVPAVDLIAPAGAAIFGVIYLRSTAPEKRPEMPRNEAENSL